MSVADNSFENPISQKPSAVYVLEEVTKDGADPMASRKASRFTPTTRGARTFAALAVATLSAAATSAVGIVNNAAHAQAGIGRDYASDAFSNPWDYSDAADIVVGDGPLLNISNARIANGQFSFDANGPGYISPLWGSYPGSLHTRYDGAASPIEASKYNRIAFKITSNSFVNSGLRWYSCADGAVTDACQGGFAFDIKPGTNVYDFELKPSTLDPALSGAWAGNITGLRLAFAGAAHMDLDWMSVYSGKAPSLAGPAGPSANVINPDIEGGESLGPKLRGKDWDMTDAADISRTYNVAGSAGGGVFNGTNASPATNDPALVMNLGCKTFKAADFHRFTVDMTFDGAFNVEDKPGGGMNQRVIWRIAGTPLSNNGTDLQNSDDLVIYPGRNRLSIDLATNPPTAITDEAQTAPRRGWVESIEHVRFDPNEDQGARKWQIHSIKLAADDMASAGSKFIIDWSDANFAPGGTATIALSSSPDGSNATPIASNVAVNDGKNTTPWTATGSGSKWVVLTINRGGYESTSVSTGPVTIGAPQYSFGVNERGKDGTLANGDRCVGSASAAPTTVPPSDTPATTVPSVLALKPGKPAQSGQTAKPQAKSKTLAAGKKPKAKAVASK
jgi:hypothetical protein